MVFFCSFSINSFINNDPPSLKTYPWGIIALLKKEETNRINKSVEIIIEVFVGDDITFPFLPVDYLMKNEIIFGMLHGFLVNTMEIKETSRNIRTVSMTIVSRFQKEYRGIHEKDSGDVVSAVCVQRDR